MEMKVLIQAVVATITM